MSHIQDNAEIAVRDMLKHVAKKIHDKTGSTVSHAEDYLDDGSVIKLRVDFDPIKGEAIFDFTYVFDFD